jgi:hypothetical protein
MNCTELCGELELRLLSERDPRWLSDARRHAEQCPTCARLLALHDVEEQLAALREFEPASGFVDRVMSRVTQLQAQTIRRKTESSWAEPVKTALLVLGGLVLGVAYIVPTAGQDLVGKLWPSFTFVRWPLLATYLTAHPPWAVMLAAIAALVVVYGLVIPARRQPRPPRIANYY